MQLVTLEDLSWTALEAAVERGELPYFSALLKESRVFRLRPEAPSGSCSVWGSIATGTAATDHGLTYPLEAWPGGLRRTTRASWLRPPVWRSLSDQGFKTASIAFPFASPGACWSGAHVDERIVEISGIAWEDWPLPLDVAPSGLREELREVRVHTSDIHPDLLGPFTRAGEDPARARVIAASLAKASTLTAVAQTVAARCGPDFMAVHLDWPRVFSSALGSLQLPPAFWTLLEGGLRNFRAIGGPQSILLLVSPGSSDGPGFIVAHRPGGGAERGRWASLRDVAPTILEQFGLRDPRFEGRSLLRTGKELSSVETPWSNEPREASLEDCARVEKFGYVLPSPPSGWPAPKLLAEAELLLEQERELATDKVREALRASPRLPHALALAGLLAFARGDVDSLEDHAAALAAIDAHGLPTAMLRAGVHVLRKERREAAPLLRRIQNEGNRDDRLKVAAAWLMLGNRSEAVKLLETIVEENPFNVPAMLALASQMDRRPFDAEQLLRRVLAIQPDHGAARTALVDVLMACGRSAEAQSVRGAASILAHP